MKMDTERERIEWLIATKFDNNKRAFAEYMGYTPQYVNNLLTAKKSLGLEPVRKILTRFEDINARWFITGEGAKYDMHGYMLKQVDHYSRMSDIISLDVYRPVMSQNDLKDLDDWITGVRDNPVKKEDLKRWQMALKERSDQAVKAVKTSLKRAKKEAFSTNSLQEKKQ